jgi:hypothetical protein
MSPTPTEAPVRRRWPIHLLTVGVYLLLALAVTWPLPLHLGDRIIANEPGQNDGYLGIWNIWWTAQALISGSNPYFTPLLFYPQGLDLFWQTLSLPQGLLALPITLTLGPLPAYNLLILASFVLGGYFTFLLVGHILRDTAPTALRDPAAMLAGAVYAFSPFHMQKVLDAQLEVAAIQWLPLFALTLLLLLERRRWYWALAAGGMLLVVGLGTWYYGLFSLIYTGLAAGLWAIRPVAATGNPKPHAADTTNPPATARLTFGNWQFNLSTLLWGLVPIAIWLLLMTPRLIGLLQTGDELLGDARLEQVDAVADLVAFWLPNPNHPLWGDAISRYAVGLYREPILWNVSLGIVASVLGLIGLIHAWRDGWRWAVLGVFSAAIALGAELQINGWQTGLAMPYAFIRDLPGIRASHRPNHIVLITILATAVFCGYAAVYLLKRVRRRRLLTAGLLLALFWIDAWTGAPPLFARAVPEPYTRMPAADGAILPIPLHINFSNSENLWYQTHHGWPIIGGFIGREPPYPRARYAPGIAELRVGSAEPDDILEPGWPELARESLAAQNIRYVMYHRKTMGSSLPYMLDLIDTMGLEADYNDDLISIYPVPAPEQPRPLAYLGPGWERIERRDGRQLALDARACRDRPDESDR